MSGHVEDDPHYLEDQEQVQKQLKEVQRKHNSLLRFLRERFPELLPVKEFEVEYEDDC